MTVYIDVLLLINFVINLLLLKCSSFLSSRSFSLAKGSLGAFLGSLGALTIFLSPFSFFTMLCYKLFFGAVMVFFSFGYENLRAFLRDFISLLVCTFLFSGFITFIYLTFAPSKMVMANGSLYLDVSALFLIGTAFISYILVTGINLVFRRKKPQNEVCTLKIRQGVKEITLKGLMDTGSSLFEPFSNLPVIVCEKELFKGEVQEHNAVKNSVRIVPFNHVGGKGILKAFLADSVVIESEGKEVEIKKGCYIALTDEKISSGFYDAVVNPAILVGK